MADSIPPNEPPRDPERSITVTWSGRTLSVTYPWSRLMEQVVGDILTGKEYPFPRYLTKRPVNIVDIGANVGAAAVYFNLMCPEARIYCYEPSRDAFRLLQGNTRSLANVQCFPHGLYNKTCSVPLYAGIDANVTNSVAPHINTLPQSETVQLKRASDEITRLALDHISLLKINTEGCEVPILSDITEHFPKIEVLFVEYHSEEDRLAFDRYLAKDFLLFYGSGPRAHRGTYGYISKVLSSEFPEIHSVLIPRPTF